MANKLRAKIEEQNKKIEELEIKSNNLLDALNNEKNQNQNTLKSKELEWQNKEKTSNDEHKAEIEKINTNLEIIKQELENKNSQLDRKELKKLAEAYGEQENINKKEEEIWLKRVFKIGIILFILAAISIWITHNLSWIESIKFYIVDVVIFSALWFCVSQYSNIVRLKHDYANRKVLAQSFHNILNNLSEDQEIRNKFIEKTTDVLCAPHASGEKEPLLTKKVLKDVAEIIGAAK